MKKTFLAILLISLGVSACSKNKPIEIEMSLPTPSPTVTQLVNSTPTFAPSPSPTPQVELHYLIEDIKGTVLVLSGDSTVPESAIEGETVETGDELITKDASEATLALNDDTMVHLSADTQIKVTDLTPNQTKGFKSRIQLLLGNILSEVEKLDQSRSSFEIEAGGVVCAVRGTAFEVQKQGDDVSTSTFHGTVEMQKGTLVQKVQENQHSDFSLKTSGFLKQRRLNPSEKKHYQTWNKKRAVVQKKRMERRSVHPGAALSPDHKRVEQSPNLKRKPAKAQPNKTNSLKQRRVQNQRQKIQSHIKTKVQLQKHPQMQKTPTHTKLAAHTKPTIHSKSVAPAKRAMIKPKPRRTPPPKKNVKKRLL